MTIRLETLESRYLLYLKAEESILNGAQSYQIGTRQLTRANLKEIKDMIIYLEKEIAVEKAKQTGQGRNRTIGIIPRDF